MCVSGYGWSVTSVRGVPGDLERKRQRLSLFWFNKFLSVSLKHLPCASNRFFIGWLIWASCLFQLDKTAAWETFCDALNICWQGCIKKFEWLYIRYMSDAPVSELILTDLRTCSLCAREWCPLCPPSITSFIFTCSILVAFHLFSRLTDVWQSVRSWGETRPTLEDSGCVVSLSLP